MNVQHDDIQNSQTNKRLQTLGIECLSIFEQIRNLQNNLQSVGMWPFAWVVAAGSLRIKHSEIKWPLSSCLSNSYTYLLRI